mmetsp:Transcript_42319/g.122395  ORF Transcript_42319/g.122395 Transcript_42319/m.122395 type:complete len:80 (+) Transcript_42319:815-1054(+)
MFAEDSLGPSETSPLRGPVAAHTRRMDCNAAPHALADAAEVESAVDEEAAALPQLIGGGGAIGNGGAKPAPEPAGVPLP